MKRYMLVLTALLAPTIAMAQHYGEVKSVCSDGSISSTCTDYNTLSIDAATDEANRTVTVNVRGYNRLVQVVELGDANTDCTSITVACYTSNDSGVKWAPYVSRNIAAGVSTDYAMSDLAVRDADATLRTLIYDIWGFQRFKCIYTANGTCSSDTIVAQWSLGSFK
jgi:hypothetical protein